jgi:hypothetical protein
MCNYYTQRNVYTNHQSHIRRLTPVGGRIILSLIPVHSFNATFTRARPEPVAHGLVSGADATQPSTHEQREHREPR